MARYLRKPSPPSSPNTTTPDIMATSDSDSSDDDMLLNEASIFAPKSRAVARRDAAKQNFMDDLVQDGMDAADRRSRIRDIENLGSDGTKKASISSLLGDEGAMDRQRECQYEDRVMQDIEDIRATLTGVVDYEEAENLIRESGGIAGRRARREKVENALTGKGRKTGAGYVPGEENGLNDSAMFSQFSAGALGEMSGTEEEEQEGGEKVMKKGKHVQGAAGWNISKVHGRRSKANTQFPSDAKSDIINAYDVGYTTFCGVRRAFHSERNNVGSLKAFKEDLVESVLPSMELCGHKDMLLQLLDQKSENGNAKSVSDSPVERRKRRRRPPSRYREVIDSMVTHSTNVIVEKQEDEQHEEKDPTLLRLKHMLQGGRFLDPCSDKNKVSRGPPIAFVRWAYRVAIGEVQPLHLDTSGPKTRSRVDTMESTVPVGQRIDCAARKGAVTAVVKMLTRLPPLPYPQNGNTIESHKETLSETIGCAPLHARWFREAVCHQFGYGDGDGKNNSNDISYDSQKNPMTRISGSVDSSGLGNFLEIWTAALEHNAVVWKDEDSGNKRKRGVKSKMSNIVCLVSVDSRVTEMMVYALRMGLDRCFYSGSGLLEQLQNLILTLLQYQTKSLGTPINTLFLQDQFSPSTAAVIPLFQSWSLCTIGAILDELSNLGPGERGTQDEDDVKGHMPLMLAANILPLSNAAGVVPEGVAFAVFFYKEALLHCLPTLQLKVEAMDDNGNGLFFSRTTVMLALLALEEIYILGEKVMGDGALYYTVLKLCFACVQGGMAQYMLYRKDFKKAKQGNIASFSSSFDADENERLKVLGDLVACCNSLKQRCPNVFTRPHLRRAKELLMGMAVQFGNYVGHVNNQNPSFGQLAIQQKCQVPIDKWCSS
uniref:Uncharacterized protein n=1 Tax=Corethron hystrix TaxID=216773 RepID=A0A6U5DN90_9STRA|mmetsp:Transcript_13088/g.28845  ORF Transcript_13088/g.28845 Transcript_13088/m.28845 type:complete len:884 (+) Transcript_13088:522-3173(+)